MNMKKGGSIMSAGAGYHSKHLATMLLHAILCMGWDGSVISKELTTFTSTSDDISTAVNPSSIVFKCVYSAVLTYMNCRRST